MLPHLSLRIGYAIYMSCLSPSSVGYLRIKSCQYLIKHPPSQQLPISHSSSGLNLSWTEAKPIQLSTART